MNTKRPRLLDLFCGAGGAGAGYYRAGFEVVGVDINPQPRYPFEFIEADAMEYLPAHGHDFDVIHTSPPCQHYSWLGSMEHRSKHPDLIAPVRRLLIASGKPYIIENVPNARRRLDNPLMLCGTMFNLNLWRHRYFEIKPNVWFAPATCCHDEFPVLVSGTPRRKGVPRKEATVQECRDAMKIEWMTRAELDEAIPPAYTQWIGQQLLKLLEKKAVAC